MEQIDYDIAEFMGYCTSRNLLTIINFPEDRNDYEKNVSITTINNYVRNLKETKFYNFHTIKKGEYYEL